MEERKGTADLVPTFCREFGPNEPVKLVMHCHDVHQPGVDLRPLLAQEAHRAMGRDHPWVSVSDRLPLDELIRLMQACDAFVLPIRAEGWGLPILEAMACGLPCIVTDWRAPHLCRRDERLPDRRRAHGSRSGPALV
jgi:hypothetical protein